MRDARGPKPTSTLAAGGRLFGAAGGLALALSGALLPGPLLADLGRGGAVLARVNGVAIREPALPRAPGSRTAAAGEDRGPALDAAVDEELLVQRALEIGLVDSERTVRKALARAVIDHAVRGAASNEPGESALRHYFAEHASRFATRGRIRARTITFTERGGDDRAADRAEQAAAALASGAAFDDVATRFGDPVPNAAPDALLAEPALRRWLGPSLTEAALSLPAGGVSAPIATPGGLVLVEVAEVEPMHTPRFEEVRTEVARAVERERGDDALRSLLERLRARAEIVYAAGAPRP